MSRPKTMQEGCKIRLHRIAAGKSQEEFAASLGITRPYLSMIECNKRVAQPWIKQLIQVKYADVFEGLLEK